MTIATNMIAIWKVIVPHRDPSLLPRQWRIAIGTQKSYKVDESKKEKRRLYESKRRKDKNADLSSWQNSPEKEDCQAEKSGGENNADGLTENNAGETYVHEAFLADWRPGISCVERSPNSGTLSRGANHEWVDVFGRKEVLRAQTVSQCPHGQSQITGVRHFASSTTQANHSVSQLYYRPYRARRTNGAQLVKLTPELPPVNLPPSVRVVSQSAFRGSLRGASSTVSASGGGSGAAATHNPFSQSKVGRFGTSDAITATQNKSSSLKDSVLTLHPEDSRIIKDKCVKEGRDVDSDLQMHPLLFQAPEDGRLSYFPLNCSNSNSRSHVDGFDKSLKSPNSTSRAIDFHPLMQRTDYVSSAKVTTCSTAPLSAGSGGNRSQDQYPCDTGSTQLSVNADPQAMGTNERANELDLEIHLSSTSKKEKASKRRDVTVNNSVKSRIMAPEKTTQCPNGSLLRQAESSSARGSELVVPSNNISRYKVDDTGDQSQPDIQMEQEELSDSDEENVEFECEEMTDSEGEGGSACEEIFEMQNKDVPSFAMKRPATADLDGKECEPKATYRPQDNIHRIPYLDDASNSSWLSLDSCAPDHPLRIMSKYDESTMDSSFAAKDLQSSWPARSCKKAKLSTRGGATQKQAVDMTHQLSLGPPSNPTVSKPRKRVSGSSTCLNIGMTVENSGSDG
ncbi:hypothetical protein EV1_036621 [Malus domestica]